MSTNCNEKMICSEQNIKKEDSKDFADILYLKMKLFLKNDSSGLLKLKESKKLDTRIAKTNQEIQKLQDLKSKAAIIISQLEKEIRIVFSENSKLKTHLLEILQ